MIQPLRAVHRGAFLALAVLLPVLLAGGLMGRHARRGTEPTAAPFLGNFVSEQVVSVDGRKVAVDVYADGADPGSLRFATADALAAPDVLVYWSEVSPSSDLPSDARLIGPYNTGVRFRAPVRGPTHGYLILFSVARKQLLGAFSIEANP